jgi:hypothetical protein
MHLESGLVETIGHDCEDVLDEVEEILLVEALRNIRIPPYV